MKTTAVQPADLARSVLAVPPLARRADLTLDPEANRALIRHLEAGGVTTLLYGGNANLYNLGLAGFAELLDLLAEAAAPDSWAIPSVGPDYGRLMDQLPVLCEHERFPTVMVLPLGFPATPEGVATGLRRFAEAYGRPVILYVKNEAYLTAELVGSLEADGLLCAVKYAVVRDDPGEDRLLAGILERVDPAKVVSGIGERPAIAHLRRFGLAGFTSGSVCLAPRSSTALLHALKKGDFAAAEEIRARFLPLEDLRDAISPLRVLHDAVTLSGVADMGPILPMLSNLSEAERARVAPAARALAALDAGLADAA
ncbi:MAG: dihydrodipicolinate synthase family protein [Tistlia sp.]|uniref:dihydrodipicolinate synthase family protein n=1 Tax=Tistlia sp. TaxID=3057121 RepID=UPI0034A2D371